MKAKTIFAATILIFNNLTAQNYSDEFNKFINAIHQVESSGRIGAVSGDNGKSNGPLQISKAYWLDAKEYSNGKLKGSYNDVSNLTYAKKVVYYYIMRYEKQALLNNKYETMARLHNSGPNWKSKKNLTNGYWNKVRKILK